MKIETGVMIMKDGKAWGTVYADGHTTNCGWVAPEDGTIYNPKYFNHPTDATYKGSPETAELSTGKVVAVERQTHVFLKK